MWIRIRFFITKVATVSYADLGYIKSFNLLILNFLSKVQAGYFTICAGSRFTIFLYTVLCGSRRYRSRITSFAFINIVRIHRTSVEVTVVSVLFFIFLGINIQLLQFLSNCAKLQKVRIGQYAEKCRYHKNLKYRYLIN